MIKKKNRFGGSFSFGKRGGYPVFAMNYCRFFYIWVIDCPRKI
jgi:hypothetical protein